MASPARRNQGFALWRCVLAASLFAILALSAVPAASADSGTGYTLDPRRNPYPIPEPYIFERAIAGDGTAAGPMLGPRDLAVADDGTVYVADSRNRRVLIFGPEGELLREITGDGLFRSPEGIFVTEDSHIWVSDRGRKLIYHLDPEGKLLQEIGKPDSAFLEDIIFTPTKLVVDKRGYVYVSVGGSYQGILVLDVNSNFRGFFGRIELPFSLGDFLKRLISTETQRRRSQRRVPDPITNMALDPDGYIYGVVPSSRTAQIRRLSSVGLNVYPEQFYGEVIQTSKLRTMPSFTGITVDTYGIVSVLEATSGRIYQYDQDGNLLLVFGGLGQQEGLFERPSNVVSGPDGRLYVLDTGNNRVQVLRPTAFTQYVHQASQLHFDGRYAEAADKWQLVLALHNQYYPAHAGVAKALWKQGDWRGSMREYFLALDRDGYSQAFTELRQAEVRAKFSQIFLGLVAVGVVLSVQGRLLPAQRRRFRERLREWHDQEALWTIPMLVGLGVLARFASLMLTSFHFRSVEPEEANLLLEALRVVGPWSSWVIVSFGISELFFGEGTMRQVAVDSAYALLPYIILTVPLALLTHALSLLERGLCDAAGIIVLGWVVVRLFGQLMCLHNFGFKRSVGVFLLALFGIVVLWAVVGLAYLLGSQVIQFFSELYFEVVY